jgi:hypothetical protein
MAVDRGVGGGVVPRVVKPPQPTITPPRNNNPSRPQTPFYNLSPAAQNVVQNTPVALAGGIGLALNKLFGYYGAYTKPSRSNPYGSIAMNTLPAEDWQLRHEYTHSFASNIAPNMVGLVGQYITPQQRAHYEQVYETKMMSPTEEYPAVVGQLSGGRITGIPPNLRAAFANVFTPQAYQTAAAITRGHRQTGQPTTGQTGYLQTNTGQYWQNYQNGMFSGLLR